MRQILVPAVAVALLTGCAADVYHPRPSPVLTLVPDVGFVVNGQEHKPGFGGGLLDAVAGNPRAEEEARAYRSANTSAFAINLVGVGLAAGGAGTLLGGSFSSSPSSPTVAAVGLSLLSGGVVFIVIGGLVAGSGAPHMWNAINMYNEGLGLSPAPAKPQQPATP